MFAMGKLYHLTIKDTFALHQHQLQAPSKFLETFVPYEKLLNLNEPPIVILPSSNVKTFQNL